MCLQPASLKCSGLSDTVSAYASLNVIRTGQVLFEADPVFRADYEERVVSEYLDSEPVLREFSAALLAR